MLVQTTAASCVSARVQKILENPIARLWLESPTRSIVVHGWRKPAKSRSWVCRVVQFRLEENRIVTEP